MPIRKRKEVEQPDATPSPEDSPVRSPEPSPEPGPESELAPSPRPAPAPSPRPAPAPCALDPPCSKGFAGLLEKRECPIFTGCVGEEEKSAKFIAINNADIPCSIEMLKGREGKTVAIKLTVISAQTAGFSKAPYKIPYEGKPFSPPDAKPLSEIHTASDGMRYMKMWTFKKSEPRGSKGARDEEGCFSVEPGCTFVFFVGMTNFVSQSGAAPVTNPLLPPDMLKIPAMSLLEITATSKNSDNLAKQDVWKITTVRLAKQGCTLASYSDNLKFLPDTLEQARSRAETHLSVFPMLRKNLEDTELPFFYTRVNPKAVVCEEKESKDNGDPSSRMIRVANWSSDPDTGSESLDIPSEVLKKACNTENIAYAMTFLHLAVNMGAVKFLIFHSKWFRRMGQEDPTSLRAMPVFDTVKMLQCVDVKSGTGLIRATRNAEDGTVEYAFRSGCMHYDEDDEKHEIVVSVIDRGELLCSKEGPSCPNDDLVLCQDVFGAKKCIEVGFSIIEGGAGTGAEEIRVLNAFFRLDRASSQGLCGGRFKRAKLGCV